jgi:two-component system phosphate regulon sensor histidine kinase PhoR
MLLNSRAVAIVFGVTIAGITTAFLGLLPEITGTALVVAFALSFSSSYILLRILAEFLFFREINNIYDALNGIEKNDITFLTNRSSSFLNPLRKVKNEINDYARIKQREIDDLKRMETFRREFIADVSHELKTPIFSAQGFVHTLLDGAVEDKKVRGKFLKKAAKSLDGLDLLVQDLLTISQMEIGQIKMHYENFDLVDLCKEVIEQLDGKAEKKEITVEQSFEKKEIYVNADFQRIYQVMINLVNNAIKYNRKNGKVNIHIATLDAEEKAEIKVSDSGRGIPEEDIGRIFERFYRVEKSRSKDRGGTGLGLSIVKHIMDGHHSRVEVVSEVDKGSTFTFWLKLGSPAQKISWEDDDEYDKDT